MNEFVFPKREQDLNIFLNIKIVTDLEKLPHCQVVGCESEHVALLLSSADGMRIQMGALEAFPDVMPCSLGI